MSNMNEQQSLSINEQDVEYKITVLEDDVVMYEQEEIVISL
jgi:hypothetical protein